MAYGVKKPAVESEKKIRKKAIKYGLDTAQIITVRSKHIWHELKGKGIPDATVFDANGNYIEYRSSDTACNAGLFGFIPDLTPNGKYNKTGKTTLATELTKYSTFKGDSIAVSETPDFYVMIYWTVWSGRLNKDHVKIWQDLAKQNKQANIKLFLANVDLQGNWPKHELDSTLAKVKKTR